MGIKTFDLGHHVHLELDRRPSINGRGSISDGSDDGRQSTPFDSADETALAGLPGGDVGLLVLQRIVMAHRDEIVIADAGCDSDVERVV